MKRECRVLSWVCCLWAVSAAAAGTGPLAGYDASAIGVPLGQDPSSVLGATWQEAMLTLCGAAELEDIPEEEYLRWERLAAYPLALNRSRRSVLLSSGLFSVYQAAALEDYRSRCGDVLSWPELGLVDGFTPPRAALLRFFLDFSPSSAPPDTLLHWGIEARGRYRASASSVSPSPASISFVTASVSGATPTASKSSSFISTGRLSARWRGLSLSVSPRVEGQFSAAKTASRSAGESVGGNVSGSALRRVWQGGADFSLVYEAQRIPLTVLAGDYHLRFGQGLHLWTGMTLSEGGTDALVRRPSGVAPYRGAAQAPPLRGLALRSDLGHFTVSLFGALPEAWIKFGTAPVGKGTRAFYGGVLSWYGSRLHAGLALSSSALSADVHANWNGVEVLGEVCWAFGGGVAALAGLRSTLWEEFRGSLLLRYYPASFSLPHNGPWSRSGRASNETGLALALNWRALTFSADVWLNPVPKDKRYKGTAGLRCHLEYAPKLPGGFQLQARARMKGLSYGSDPLTGNLRLQAGWTSGTTARPAASVWTLSLRADLSLSQGPGWNLTAIQGWRGGVWDIHLTEGIYRADRWAQRIYVYMHDVPGSFNLPALYGRGLYAGCYLGLKPLRGLSLGLHAAWRSIYHPPVTPSAATPAASSSSSSLKTLEQRPELSFYLKYTY